MLDFGGICNLVCHGFPYWNEKILSVVYAQESLSHKNHTQLNDRKSLVSLNFCKEVFSW